MVSDDGDVHLARALALDLVLAILSCNPAVIEVPSGSCNASEAKKKASEAKLMAVSHRASHVSAYYPMLPLSVRQAASNIGSECYSHD